MEDRRCARSISLRWRPYWLRVPPRPRPRRRARNPGPGWPMPTTLQAVPGGSAGARPTARPRSTMRCRGAPGPSARPAPPFSRAASPPRKAHRRVSGSAPATTPRRRRAMRSVSADAAAPARRAKSWPCAAARADAIGRAPASRLPPQVRHEKGSGGFPQLSLLQLRLGPADLRSGCRLVHMR